MDLFVADTHAMFWYLTASPLPGADARRAFDEAAAGRARVYVPAIVVAELYFMNVKLGRPLDFAKEWKDLQSVGQFVFLPFLPDDVLDFDTGAAVTEMHDRMIVGVARRTGATCLTRDAKIVGSGVVQTLW